MTFIDQMLSRHIAAQQRVILDQIAGAVERRPVHHHRGNRRITLDDLFRRLMRFGTEQQQPVDAFLHQRFQVTVHALLIAFGITQHQAVAALEAAALHAAHQFRIKRVGTGRDQHADGARLVELQAAGQRRRRIVEFFNCSVNFLPNRLADEAIVIDYVGDSRGRNARHTGDIFHCGQALPLLT